MMGSSEGRAPSTSQRLLLVAVGLSSLVHSMQGSALNAILPVVARSLDADLPMIQWVVLVYLIVSGGLFLAFGRLGDMVGQRRLFLLGLVVFIAGSILCSLAPNVLWLIFTRIVQAVGGGMLTSASSPLVVQSLPSTHRGRGLSAQFTMVYCGHAAGPGIGGILADTLGWQWVFLVNVPVGLLAAAIIFFAIAKDRPNPSTQSFDIAGAFAFMAGLASFFLLISGGGERGWPLGGSVFLLVLTLVSTGTFLALELSRREPMLDLRLFKSRYFSAATISAMVNYTAFSAMIFLVPFYLVNGLGYDATTAGILITATSVTMIVFAPFSGWLFDKFGPRLPTSLGMVLLSCGIFLMSRLGSDSSVAEIVPRLILPGMGLGLFTSANGSAIMGSVPMQRQGVANGVVSTARQLGMMLGVAIATTVFSARYPFYRELGEAGATAAATGDALFLAATIALVGVFTSLVRGKAHGQNS